MSSFLHIAVPVAGFIAVLYIASIIEGRRLRRMAAERTGDSICTFARSLDFRHLDTQVIRATHEELQRHYGGSFPIRTTDRFDEDLQMDRDDLSDIFISVAKRCGRDLQFTETWPKDRRVETVADMIHNICDLPKSHVA
jgi:hypothetical protein